MVKKLKQANLKYISFSSPRFLSFLVIFAALGGYIIFRSFAAGTTPVGQLFITANGNDNDTTVCKRYVSPPASYPVTGCKTFNKAYNLANAGDIVEIGGGSYNETSLAPLTSGSKATATPITQRPVCQGTCVNFQPMPGATVTLAPSTGLFKINASHVRFKNIAGATFKVNGGLNIWPENEMFATAQTPDDVQLDGIEGIGALNIACSTNWRVENMSIGPSYDVSTLDIQAASSANDCAHNPQWGVVYKTTVHDSNTSNPSNHVDCTHIYDSQNITLDSVIYYGCQHIGVFADSANGPDRCCSGLVIKNSVFGESKTGASTIELAGASFETTFANSQFINNTVLGTWNFLSNGVFPSTMVVANNIFAQRFNTCGTGSITFSKNAMTLFDGIQGPTDGQCAGSGNFRLSNTTDCIISEGNPNASPFAAPPDAHLRAGAPCIDTASPTFLPALDFEGQVRPAGATGDIGADEYSTNAPSPPTPAPSLTLSANPTSLTSGQSSTLSWSVSNATSCTAAGSWSGAKSPTGGNQTVTPSTSSTYSLSCSGSGGTTTASASISVNDQPPPIPPNQPPSPPTTIKPGDVNRDGLVNLADLSIMLSNYTKTYSQADFNNSGQVDLADLSILLSNYGT